jgi:hypothetical protein
MRFCFYLFFISIISRNFIKCKVDCQVFYVGFLFLSIFTRFSRDFHLFLIVFKSNFFIFLMFFIEKF